MLHRSLMQICRDVAC